MSGEIFEYSWQFLDSEPILNQMSLRPFGQQCFRLRINTKETMKIQLASDLHLEHLHRKWPRERLVKPAPGADVLVLAGDIHNYTGALKMFSDWPVPLVYVAGNHESYGHEIGGVYAALREESGKCGIHFLSNDSVVLSGIRFLGCTLWTSYRLRSNRTQSQLMKEAEYRLNDHNVITVKDDDYLSDGRSGQRYFRAQDALDRHEQSRLWLREQLHTDFDGKTVVVSHHAPHPLSVHTKYLGDPLNAAFASDLTDIFNDGQGVDLWLHGHMHDAFDYIAPSSKTRVVANPAGYCRNANFKREHEEFLLENAGFNPELLIEV